MMGRRRHPESTPAGDMPEGEAPEQELAEEVVMDDLRESLARLEDERATLLRAIADERNRVNAARRDVEEARRHGVTSVARDVITALDHFDLALSHDLSAASAEQIVVGVRAIKDELVRTLGRHGVVVIAPDAGEAFDPLRHEAFMQQPAEGVPPGHVVSVFQVGYALNDRLIRPAKVSVAPLTSQEPCTPTDAPVDAEESPDADL
ncbi:MAG: nucleotide exchange factor GrpE [Phycisphaeraceae bacterium]|nr:nucleotide exchange factor GrpE [Phycisphaeraceae bacterium]